MKNRQWRAPSVRAILLLASIMTVAMFLSVAAVLLDLRKKELDHARSELSSLTRILSEQTSRTFDGVALTLHVARERLSDDFGQQLELDSHPVNLLLRARISGLPQINSIFVVDRDGFGVNSSRPDFISRLPMAQREFFKFFADGNKDEFFISSPEKARVDGRWAFYVSTPVYDASQQLRAVLVASINIGYFESLYESIDLDFVSRIRLLNKDGFLLAGKPHDEDMFGKSGGQNAALENLLAGAASGMIENQEKQVDGSRLVTYRPVVSFPLVVSASVDEDEALTPWRRVMRPIFAGLFLVVALLWMTTFLLLRNLLRRGTLEAARRESDAQMRHMVQSVKDAIITINAARHIVVFNESAERLFGVPTSQAIGLEIGAFFARCLDQPQRKVIVEHLDGGWQSPEGQTRLINIGLGETGKELPIELSLSLASFRDEQLLTAVFRDLSERQHSERELLETNRQLQALTAAIQNNREEHRARISRELHDELGQQLTGMRMEVSWLGGRLPKEFPDLRDKIMSIKQQIDQTITSVRRISAELRPLVLDDLGFAAAAAWYVDQFSGRTGIPVALTLPTTDPVLGDALATTLFRVLQESLTNIARHAEATAVDVALENTPGGWKLSVQDNGIGFVYDPGQKNDIGLIGMRERAQILGGQFTLKSAPGQGTLVEVLFPACAAKETS